MTESLVKKPSKKERIALKRAERDKMLDITTANLKMTLECPECHIQQTMTLEDYFEKINYGSFKQKVLRCETCESRPSLMFYKVNQLQVAAAGLNWQRKKMGIGKEDMHKRIEEIEDNQEQYNHIMGKIEREEIKA